MVENPNFSLDPLSLEAYKAVQEFVNIGTRADFLSLMYPDKEAMKASDMVCDLLDAIEDGLVEIPNIDSVSLIYWGNLSGENDDPIMIKGEEENNKLVCYVSLITGVSVERIEAAATFWNEQFWDE